MRLLITITAFVFIFLAPHWLYLPIIAVGIIVFPFYIEALPLALLIDSLYGRFFFTIIAAALILFAIPLRAHLRFNA